MTGLMFPKQQQKKKNKRHGKSLLHQHDGTCYLCMELHGICDEQYVEKHHIFGGNPRRDYSEEDGLFVWLCVKHHTAGEHAAHTSRAVADFLHKAGQQAYERDHTREEFMIRYGKNYL